MNLDPGRQSFHDLALVEVFVQSISGKKQAYARLQCKCGGTIKLTLSRWRMRPPYSCIKCAIKKNRIIGNGLKRLLQSPP